MSDHCSVLQRNILCRTKEEHNERSKDPAIFRPRNRPLSLVYLLRTRSTLLLLDQYSSGCPKQASAWTSAVKPNPHHDGIIIHRDGKASNNNNVFHQHILHAKSKCHAGHSPPINQATPTIVILAFPPIRVGVKVGNLYTPIPPIPQCNERATARLTKSRGNSLPRSIRRWWSPIPTVPIQSPSGWYSLICL